jgi:ATP-binding cassette subfamily C protein CydC
VTGVTFRRAAAGAPVLRDISLSLDGGRRLALVGASGSGKSTLMGLIAGELSAETGSVASLASTLLPQRTELFAGSLGANLRLADPKATDAQLLNVIVAAGLGPMIETLPSGLGTPLGEGGLGLSGGEARRLALARVFLRDTPLWLLDEPTEALDEATARDVLERLAIRAAGRSLVIATHVRREAELADLLAVMSGGGITAVAERGSRDFERVLAALRPG